MSSSGKREGGGEDRADRLAGDLRREEAELRPERLGAPLRPERLGALAEELPGWRVEGVSGLERELHWPTAAAAGAFVALVLAVADGLGVSPQVEVVGRRVTVTLGGGGAELTEAHVEVARALDGRWGGPRVAVRAPSGE